MDWQPMETAPKDGYAILATNATYQYDLQRCAVVFWDDDTDEEGWHTPFDADDAPAMSWLTHWMPLPEPPK